MIGFRIDNYCFIQLIRLVVLVFAVPGFFFASTSGTPAQTTQEKYDQIVANWRSAAKDAAVASGRFYVAKREESSDLKKIWLESLEEGNRQLELLKPVAIELFKETDQPDEDFMQLLIRIMESELDSGLYENAFDISELLLANKPDDDQLLSRILKSKAITSIFTNRFERAKEIESDHVYLIRDLPTKAQLLYHEGLDKLKKQHDTEIAIQEKEAEVDDLPRVEIKTTKGTIVIELFENEAPGTVGNFISLIEKRAYDEMVFHRVINDFMAQTGGFNVQGQRAIIGYTIYDECAKPDRRLHFRGSVSMAKTSEPDSGSSQFFFNYVPTPGLNGRHTVFGRVISGWNALDRLNRTHFIDENGEEKPIGNAVPDQILSARVLRKRDHEYKPDNVK